VTTGKKNRSIIIGGLHQSLEDQVDVAQLIELQCVCVLIMPNSTIFILMGGKSFPPNLTLNDNLPIQA